MDCARWTRAFEMGDPFFFAPHGLVFRNAHVVVDKETGKPFAKLLV
jgi:hypothetical protein